MYERNRYRDAERLAKKLKVAKGFISDGQSREVFGSKELTLPVTFLKMKKV
jgi:hypothetical protein